MAPNPPHPRLRRAAIAAFAGLLHLLLLCSPVALVGGNFPGTPAAVFLLGVSVWCVVEGMASGSNVQLPVNAHGPRCLPLAIGLCLLLTFWVALLDAAFGAQRPLGIAAVAGASLMTGGIVLRYHAIRTLGTFFLNEVAIVPGQSLVTAGIYRWLRHPSELGTICLAAGGTLVLGSEYGLAACGVLVSAIVWRTRLEDEMLRKHYGAEFDRYAARVPALLPGIRPSKRWRGLNPAT